jgi:hypothetical protein
MRTFVATAVSSALAFAATFTLVPQRPVERVPPSWFELPGRPLTVDGQPVDGWAQANELLRQAARRSESEAYGAALQQPPATRPVEREGREVRVTWLRHGGAGSSGPAVETAIVRTFLPLTIDYSRASSDQLVRYETVTATSID